MSLNLNSTNDSLHKRTIETSDNGVITKVPALSKYWAKSRSFTKYFPLTIRSDVNRLSAENEWLSKTTSFKSDMIWLLRLEHFRFWSYIIYEPTCVPSIASFLQDSIPYYISVVSITSNEEVISQYKEILTIVIAIISRLLTDRESEADWIDFDELGNILYSNFIITIPMLMDMLVTYGRSNMEILNELFAKVFSLNAQYSLDLETALCDLMKSFEKIQEKCDNNDDKTSFTDLAIFTLDCSATIGILLSVYSQARQIALEIKFEQKLTHFYDVTVPSLYQQIHIIDPTSKSLEYLNESRMELLSSFNQLSNHYLEQILNEPSERLMAAEHFLAILQEALSDHIFVTDYQRLYSVVTEIEIVQQACSELDMMKVEYILNAYMSAENNQIPIRNDNLAQDYVEGEVAAALPIADSNDPQVQEILNIFPHLKIDFVHKLLERYETTEKAIADYLEGNLPPDLIESENGSSTSAAAPSKSETANDFDFLDQFNFPDNSKVIVKKGKGFPGDHTNATSLLNDKSHINALKERYGSYGLVAENESDEEYNDEYDDSYDAIAESESKSVRKITRSNDFVIDEFNDDDDENESDKTDDDKEMGSGRDKSKDFCENPEIIRERLARNRHAKFVARAGNKPQGNVVGNPKGQGQDSNTQFNRHKKDVNKGTRANHNRRQGAAFKRNRGMIPS